MSLLIQNENFITQSGYKEIFLFNEIFCLLSQILDFTAFGPKAQCTVVGRGDKTYFDFLTFLGSFGHADIVKLRFLNFWTSFEVINWV